jgi:hypothetical protein
MKNNSLDILKKQGSGFRTPEKYFENLEDEILSKIAAGKFPKKEGFNLPASYFEKIEDDVFLKLDEDKITKSLKTEIPEGYFNTIEDRVFNKLKKDNLIQPKVIDLRSKLIKVFTPLAIAASLLLFFIVNYNNNEYNIENVATSEIDTWIEEDLITLEAYQIAEVFSDVNLNEEIDSEDEELLEYLNGTDIESILNN